VLTQVVVVEEVLVLQEFLALVLLEPTGVDA
jgi:hypothetical protein